MRGPLVLYVLLSLTCVAPTCAASPGDDPAPVPPSTNLDGPALPSDEALIDSGPTMSALPATTGPRHLAYRGFETAQQSDDCRCCSEYFGGFGPLWGTYCADKHRCCGAAVACGSSRCCPRSGLGCRAECAPLSVGSRWQLMRLRIAHPGCRIVTSCDCDSAVPAVATPAEATSEGVDQPAEPTPAQLEKSAEPAPPTPPDPPNAQETITTSSRRGWSQQRGGRLPR
jgi:hypothetical protein